MINKQIKIYFLGSGPIAIPVLKALKSAENIELVGVGTQPDRPGKRKHQLTATPLAEAAKLLHLEVARINDVNAEEFLKQLNLLNIDFIVVVSFGQLLKAPILNLPRFGCINVHASILPFDRGASPIVQALIRRDKETGVSFMKMEKGLDSGPVYTIVHRPLDGSEYADTLEIELGEIAGKSAPEILEQIYSGVLSPIEQNHSLATRCHKISKLDGMINWNQKAADIEAKIRAYTPWPGVFGTIKTSKGKQRLMIKRARVVDYPSLEPGKSVIDEGHWITGCNEQALEILELAPAGSKIMSAGAFLNGLRGEIPLFIEDLP